jgi:regulator of sigma E protease
MTWLVVAGGLLLLVFLHELGHFSVALLVGVRPRSFYVGFPPALVKFKRNGIEYGLGAIPLGGMVRIPGMNRPAGRDVETFMSPAVREDAELLPIVRRVPVAARRSASRAVRELEEGTGPDAYWRQATWRRIAIIAAGPVANIVVAFVIFFVVALTGAPSSSEGTTKVGLVQQGKPAAAAGLREGDRIVAVNGKATATFQRISTLVRASHGKPITMTVQRGGQRLTLGPRKTVRSGDRWIWGFGTTAKLVSYPFGTSIGKAGSACWTVLTGTIAGFSDLVHAKGRSQISGPVGIVRTSQTELKAGFSYYLELLGLISMSLALLNLLPLLPLDGGHILFSLIEAVRRRALAREVYERVSMAGIALILVLMYIALTNDFTHKSG